MTRTRSFSLAVLLILALAVPALQAQEGRGFEWWVYQDVVIDGKMDQYLDARKEIVAMLHKDRISSSEFGVVAMQSRGAACVVYSAPVAVGGERRDATNLSVDWEEVFTELGPKYLQAWKRMRDATRVSAEYLIRFRPDLSYVPDNDRLRPEEQAFVYSEQFFTTPSSKASFEQLLRDTKHLYRESRAEDGYRVFEIVVGPEIPGFMVAVGARSPEDLEAALARDRVVLGAEGEALKNRVNKLASKVEKHEQIVRLDLSYFPQ